MLTRDEAKRPMKLSDAIRLGAMLRPQAFGYFLDRSGGSCAWGAAFEALGLLDTARIGNACISKDAVATVRPFWRSIAKQSSECPHCDAAWWPVGGHNRDVQGVIVHLNNDHRWTREQIADWVETLEAAQAHGEPASVVAVREETEQPGVPLRA